MRLICPKCSAQYEIDDSLVPAGGREVECSGCGHVWFQPGRMAGADLAPAQLSRPLNESILSVLREEAERELNARKTEQDQPPPAETPAAKAALPPVPQPQQLISAPVAPQQTEPKPRAPAARPPAETPTEATGAPPHIRDNFSFDWQALRDSGPQARPATELPDVSALAATLVHEPARQDPPATEAESAATPAPPPVVARKTYRQGLIAGVLAMALLAGLYSAAPALADKGAVGAKLMEWRELADQGHNWIYARFRGRN